MRKILPLLLIALIVSSSFLTFDYAYAVDNNCNNLVISIIQQRLTNFCFDTRLDTLENAPAGSDDTLCANVGSGSQVYKDGECNFRTLIGSSDISVTQQTDTITIDFNGTVSGESTVCGNVGTGNTIHVGGSNCNAKSLIAGTGITITDTTDDWTIASTVVDTNACTNTGTGEAVCESANNINSLIAGTGITIVDTTGDLTISSTGGDTTVCANVGGFTEIFKDGNCNFKTLNCDTEISCTSNTNDINIDVDTIGQQQIFVHQSVTKTNIGTSYIDVWVTLFDMEEMTLLHPNNATLFYISFQYDYVGTGTQQCRFVNTANNAEVLYESSTFTADQNSNLSGWFTKPAWATSLVYSIEMQCKSTVAGDDPIVKGYIVYAK